MMNAANTANYYKNQQIMTASPEQLTLLLYNGALRFIAESIQAMEHRESLRSYQANMRAQDIVCELRFTLDMTCELSKTWKQLYDYVEYRLIHGNIDKDTVQLEEARKIMTELREAWVGAMKEVQQTKVVNK